MPEPILDPLTGKPTVPPAGTTPPDPQLVQVDKTEWDDIKTKVQRLDAFEAGARSVQPAPAPAPAAPTGPTFAEQVTEIDTQIVALNTKIDEAVTGGKAVSQFMNERDALTHKRTRMQIKHEDIDPAFNMGIQTIDQISAEVTRGKMPHYDLVQVDVEAALAALPAEQRMNPQMRQAAYNIAVGQNIEKIMDAQKEEMLRSVTPPANGEPPAGGKRTGAGGGEGDAPKPKEVLSANALAAIKNKGITVKHT